MQALPNTIRHLDLRDTILDAKHLADAFADYVLEFHPPVHSGPPEPPFRVTFPPFSPDPDLPSEPLPAGTPEPAEKTLVIQSYTPEQTTPFPQLEPPKNRVRFNKEQLQVIISALQPGLTMCVGPPGTGKTDTAVQVGRYALPACTAVFLPTQRAGADTASSRTQPPILMQKS
jgi:intron-binding protein aquarius